MHSLIVQRGRQKLHNIMEDGLGRDLMNAGRFCFSCEQIFASRRCLEEHACPVASHICSCGTEFTEYNDMLEHSTTHEPGHQVLDHETIKKRRIEKRIEEEEQLKRLQTGEVVWQAPIVDDLSSISLPAKPRLQVPITSGIMPQPLMQSRQISQVPELYPSVSQTSVLQSPASSLTDMKNIFAGVGAPTVDLWTLYQPVVLLSTVRKFNRTKPYFCGKCGQCFITKTSLVAHHSSHVTDKVSGCIGCGLLLSSKKIVPRFHVCNQLNNSTKFRLVTARPLNNKKPYQAQKPSAGMPHAASSFQLKSQNFNAANKVTQAPHVTSTLQVKSQNIRSYNQSNRGICVTQTLPLKSQNPSTSKPYVIVPVTAKSQSPNPSVFNKSSRGLPITPYGQSKTPTKSASGLSNKSTPPSSGSSGYTCRVCHLPFETAQLLQRHKCIKAQEFMAQHVRRGKHYKLKRVTPMASPNSAQMNGVPAPGNIKKNQVMAVSLTKGQGVVPVNGTSEVDTDDDCIIIESGPDKPAEMIYQVTSSVPIKT